MSTLFYINAAGFSVVTNKKGLKRKSQKHKSSRTALVTNFRNSKKKAATTQLRPVILQANLGDKGGRPLASYNPITIDRCLGKAIGQYESCKPIRNGNLLIICKTSNQVKTLLDLDSLSDSAGNSIPIIASTTKPSGARGVIYNVPLDITNDDLLECLKMRLDWTRSDAKQPKFDVIDSSRKVVTGRNFREQLRNIACLQAVVR